MDHLFRPDPKLPVTAMKTYSVRMPVASHFRKATCAEVDCPAYLNGWRTVLTDGQVDMIDALRASGRQFREDVDGQVHTFWFEPGTPCFRATEHRLSLERDPILTVRAGDWRGNPSGWVQRHTRAEDWVEDFALHQQRVADQAEKG